MGDEIWDLLQNLAGSGPEENDDDDDEVEWFPLPSAFDGIEED
jgi:hypothetical protein